jgi:hypothetical protein
MATAQEFDALDGLKITGSLEVGANVAVDTNTLFVDTVNDRVGINRTPTTSLGNLQIEVADGKSAIVTTATAQSTDSAFWSSLDRARFGYSNGKILIDDKSFNASSTNKSLEINLFNVTRAFFDQSANTISLTGDVNITAPTGGGLDIDGVGTSESTFHAASDSTGKGAVAARWIYTNFIEAYNEKQSASCGIAIGAITGGAAENGTDEISMVTNGFQVANFQTSAILLNKATTIAGTLTVTDNIVHSGDTDTLIAFDTNNIKLYAGNASTQKINITTSQVSITDSLDVGLDIQARKITAEDYFIETKVAATSGTGTKTYNLSAGASFEHTATGTFTANFTNVPGTNTTSWTIKVVNNGSAHAITWRVGGADVVNWSEGTQPPESTGTDIYSFISIAGTVYGSLAIRNAS